MRRFDAWAVIVVAALATLIVFQRAAIGELSSDVSSLQSEVSVLRAVQVDQVIDIGDAEMRVRELRDRVEDLELERLERGEDLLPTKHLWGTGSMCVDLRVHEAGR